MGIRDRDEHIGLVAQEVQKVIPEAVTENKKGYLLVNNDPIIWTMLNAIKEQQRQIRKQQQQIRAQQSLVKGEQAEIARLSSLVKAMQASISTNGRTGSEIRTARATVTMVRQ